MISINVTDEDLDYITSGGVWGLNPEEFNCWEAITGPQTVSINGMETRALVWYEEPSCPCCRGCFPAYHWELQIF